MAVYQTAPLSAPHLTKQDFWDGAGLTHSLHPATPPGYEYGNEFGFDDPLGSDKLEAFQDVMLPTEEDNQFKAILSDFHIQLYKELNVEQTIKPQTNVNDVAYAEQSHAPIHYASNSPPFYDNTFDLQSTELNLMSPNDMFSVQSCNESSPVHSYTPSTLSDELDLKDFIGTDNVKMLLGEMPSFEHPLVPDFGETLDIDQISIDEMPPTSESLSSWSETQSPSSSEISTPKISQSRERKPRQKMTKQERYLRKKEQNKVAAVRYRNKKKQEHTGILSTIKESEDEQNELKKKYSTLQQEMSFLKKIILETYVAKGILSKDVLES